MEGIGVISGGVGLEARSVGEGVERVVAGGVGIEDIVRPIRRSSRMAVIGEMGELVRRTGVMLCLALALQLEIVEDRPRKWGPKLRAKWELSAGGRMHGKKTKGC